MKEGSKLVSALVSNGYSDPHAHVLTITYIWTVHFHKIIDDNFIIVLRAYIGVYISVQHSMEMSSL